MTSLVIAAAVLGAAGLGFAAGSAVLPPQGEVVVADTTQIYEVQEGTVSRSVSLSVVAVTDVAPVAMAASAGTVTDVLAVDPTLTTAGDILLRIDERPVIATSGHVPYFRELGPEHTGRDVEQLQRFLVDMGHDVVEPDGRYGASTSRAVRQWRRSVGLPQGDRVEAGLLVAVGELPATLAAASEIAVGRLVSEGQELVSRVREEPRFYLPLREGQLDLVPLDAEVLIAAGEATWMAKTGRAIEVDEGVEVELLGPDGAPPCAEECARWLAPTGETVLPAQVIVVPVANGPVVPIAAVATRADGSTYVELAAGGDVDITVMAAADGLAVVDGIEVGTTVVLWTSP